MVLSSHSNPSLSSPIGHQLYCDRHGYDYVFGTNPYVVPSGGNYKLFDHKLVAILSALRHSNCRWLMWIDHDAFIMDHARRLEEFTPAEDGPDAHVNFVFCDSPRLSDTRWTRLNSGVFFVRNCTETRALLHAALMLDIEVAQAWWRPETYGLFTTGDQDKIVHVLHPDHAMRDDVRIRDHRLFNARPSEYSASRQEHFVCHFAMGGDKVAPMREMMGRFGLDANLMPAGTVYPFSVKASKYFMANASTRKSVLARAFGKARRVLKAKLGG